MKFVVLEELLSRAKNIFEQRYPEFADGIHYIISPYRICPLGAHVDHQGGLVMGRTIDAYSVIAVSVIDKPEALIYSDHYKNDISFALSGESQNEFGWGQYAVGAAMALSRSYDLEKGFIGVIVGTLPGGGLSSSASIGLAYLHALAFANELSLTKEEYVELDLYLENVVLGLSNGVLDQSIIEYSKPESMVFLDTRDRNVEHLPDPTTASQVSFLIAYSGFSRNLLQTGFNDRVRECHQAAQALGEFSGDETARILSDLPVEVYERFKDLLPVALYKRAQHFFSETDRVRRGITAWLKGDFEQFGNLMNQSCESSIHHYESGSEALIVLSRIVQAAPGVLGARFSGGGYGGCVVGLVEKEMADHAIREIDEKYASNFPSPPEVPLFVISNTETGVRVL